jgi:hypothetical protein
MTMGRYPIGDKAMTNAQKQKSYRKRLEEKRRRMIQESYILKNENRNLRYENARLHTFEGEDIGDIEYEKLKRENARLKKENKNLTIENEDLVVEIKELKDELSKKKGKTSDAFERAQARSTSGAWTKR